MLTAGRGDFVSSVEVVGESAFTGSDSKNRGTSRVYFIAFVRLAFFCSLTEALGNKPLWGFDAPIPSNFVGWRIGFIEFRCRMTLAAPLVIVLWQREEYTC